MRTPSLSALHKEKKGDMEHGDDSLKEPPIPTPPHPPPTHARMARYTYIAVHTLLYTLFFKASEWYEGELWFPKDDLSRLAKTERP